MTAGFQHTVVEHDIDGGGEVHATVRGNVDDVLAPRGYALVQAAIFRPENIEKPVGGDIRSTAWHPDEFR